ncbi:hypothetical protein OIV83_003443 [Microbotryomycetes sp. JL201]|nr:hypothetical protein OIV83_003443 [Microbotryomycetes sp. JL201]
MLWFSKMIERDIESADDVSATEEMEKAARSARIKRTLVLAGMSCGVIYGDIGTSPLYVLNAVFPTSGPVPSTEDVIGAVSAVLWAITIIPLIKYAFVALEFGNPAGPFALYAALFPPPEETDNQRTLTTHTTMSRANKMPGSRLIDRLWIKYGLFVWVLFAVALTVSDGLLTPAVSVTSAVTGISVAAPSVASSVVPISIAILVVLFLVQPFGTHRVGSTFAPIVFFWLGLCGVQGIVNLTHYPAIFRALDPSRAVMLFVRTKNFDLLAGVLLAITGVEALFANLAQFSKASIRLAFTFWVYPCLIFAYLGQGAKLIVDGENVIKNVFFQSIPGGVGSALWYITWLFAVLAAVIASQAMITATFSLVQQLTGLKAMPPVKIVHTADNYEGQIYVPLVNVLLLIGCVGLTAGFGTDVALTNAYGFAVSGVMFITTCFISISLVYMKGQPAWFGVIFFFVSGFFDAIFFGAALKKVPHGAWFPLGLAGILCAFLSFWTWAKHLESKFDATHRHRLNDVMSRVGVEQEDPEDDAPVGDKHETLAVKGAQLAPRAFSSTSVPSYKAIDRPTLLARLPVFAFFHNQSANTLSGAPHAFSTFLNTYPALPAVIVFFNVRRVGVPHTEGEARFVVTRARSFEGMSTFSAFDSSWIAALTLLRSPGIYSATLRLGYRDKIDLSNIAQPIRDRIVAIETRIGGADLNQKIATMDEAIATSVTHILPNFHVKSEPSATNNKIARCIRKFVIEDVFRRIQLLFDDYDAFKFGNDGDVLRIGVSAPL